MDEAPGLWKGKPRVVTEHIRVTIDVDDVAVFQKSIKQRCRQHGVAEDPSPLLEAFV